MGVDIRHVRDLIFSGSTVLPSCFVVHFLFFEKYSIFILVDNINRESKKKKKGEITNLGEGNWELGKKEKEEKVFGGLVVCSLYNFIYIYIFIYFFIYCIIANLN